MDDFDERTTYTTRFLVMWCNEGIECIFNITSWEMATVFEAITGDKSTQNIPSLKTLILRARANTGRQYEIYMFDSYVSENEVRRFSEEYTQQFVDFVRKNGDKVYSDYNPLAGRKIL